MLCLWMSCRQSETGAANGSWHTISVLAGTGMNAHDLQLTVNDCGPRALKVYGSSSADLLTVKEGMCSEIDPPIVQIIPASPEENVESPRLDTTAEEA